VISLKKIYYLLFRIRVLTPVLPVLILMKYFSINGGGFVKYEVELYSVGMIRFVPFLTLVI
jgi:hypothetical protein